MQMICPTTMTTTVSKSGTGGAAGHTGTSTAGHESTGTSGQVSEGQLGTGVPRGVKCDS